ncbi:MAG: alpha/beta hydrolase, partial [Proteobacteria bacterium]
MKQMLFTIIVFSLSILSLPATASTANTSAKATVKSSAKESKIEKGYVQLADGIDRYVEISQPKAGKPWIVFTNGLVYDLERWGPMDAELRAAGFGILHYYFRGQDWSLAREVEQVTTPLFFKTGLQSKDFADELAGILQQLGIEEKVTVVGLSYGAHIAASFAEAYPEKVDQVVFMAPLVIPLEKYQPQGQWLDWNLAWVRTMWGSYFYEYAYRQIYGSYLEKRVESRVPEHVSHIAKEYKESLFHLIRVVRDFDLRKFKFSQLEQKSVHFMLSTEEVPQAFVDQMQSFENLSADTQGA